jgi:hypothetical protein
VRRGDRGIDLARPIFAKRGGLFSGRSAFDAKLAQGQAEGVVQRAKCPPVDIGEMASQELRIERVKLKLDAHRLADQQALHRGRLPANVVKQIVFQLERILAFQRTAVEWNARKDASSQPT